MDLGSVFTTVLNGGWKFYLAALLASAALLFFPDWLAIQLGLDEIRSNYRTYVGITLLASASLMAVTIISGIAPMALRPWRDWRFKKVVYQTLCELTQEEKDFLRSFIFGEANTVLAPVNDGVAGGLAAKKIIYRSSHVSYGLEWPYNLQPLSRKLLNAHPELLG